MQFGCQGANGSTDDTAAYQRVLDIVAIVGTPGGSTIKVPTGVINSTLPFVASAANFLLLGYEAKNSLFHPNQSYFMGMLASPCFSGICTTTTPFFGGATLSSYAMKS